MGVYIVVSVLILIASALMVLVVLVQNSKGGGLASSFSSSNQVMGVRRTTDFLEKFTWGLAIALVVLSISATAFLPRQGELKKSAIEEQIQQVQDPSQVPNFPQAVRDSTK